MNKKSNISVKTIFVALFLIATSVFAVAQNSNSYSIWRGDKVIGRINGSDVDSVKINPDTKEMLSYLSNVDSLVFGASTGEATDKDQWKILFCNSDARFWTGHEEGNGPSAILDNNFETYWNGFNESTGWWEYDDYLYDHTDYHAFSGNRSVSPVTIVIDLKKSRVISGIGIVHSWWGSCRIKTIEVYVSDDPAFLFKPKEDGGEWDDYQNVALNNWKKALTFSNIPNERTNNDIFWYDLPSEQVEENINDGIKGRFLKLKMTEWWEWPYPSMTEFYIKEVKE
jgi:hypothetical protein